jgi:WD40 repeat protein
VPAAPCTLLSRFQGHSDIISGIGYVHALDCYITSSWDGALRLWKRPQPAAAAAVTSTSTGKPTTAAASGDAAYLLPEDSEDAANYVSEYEKAHPLVMPKALSQVSSTATPAPQIILHAMAADSEKSNLPCICAGMSDSDPRLDMRTHVNEISSE